MRKADISNQSKIRQKRNIECRTDYLRVGADLHSKGQPSGERGGVHQNKIYFLKLKTLNTSV